MSEIKMDSLLDTLKNARSLIDALTKDDIGQAMLRQLDHHITQHAEEVARLMAERDRLADDLQAIIAPAEVGGGIYAHLAAENRTLRAEVDALKASRGRCKKHMNEPGPSLYHDCCESERLRELVREQAAQLTRLQPEKAAAVEVLRGWLTRLEWSGVDERHNPACPVCDKVRYWQEKKGLRGRDRHDKSCALAAAISGGAA